MAEIIDLVDEEGAEPVRVAASLTSRDTVRELAATFRQAEADVRKAFALIVGAEARLNATFKLGGNRDIYVDATRYGHNDEFDKVDRAVNRLRRRCWDVLVERLEIRRFVSVERWQKLQAEIGDDQSPIVVPELSDENIAAFVEQNVVGLPLMISEAVREVYAWLRPRARSQHGAGKYVTNSLLEIGPKVVLPGVLESGRFATHYRVHNHSQELACLERVFQMLDGRGLASKVYSSELEVAIGSEACTRTGTFETRYFRGRCFDNGNLHLWFLDLSLLAEFNRIAGGKTFRPRRPDPSP